MSDFNKFFDLFKSSISDDTFVKLTLSKPYRKSEGLINVYVRLFVVDERPVFQFKYRHPTEEYFKQFKLEEATSQIELLLNESLRVGTIFTLNEDVLVTVSKNKNITYRASMASFKNKLPEISLGS